MQQRPHSESEKGQEHDFPSEQQVSNGVTKNDNDGGDDDNNNNNDDDDDGYENKTICNVIYESRINDNELVTAQNKGHWSLGQ